MRLLILSEQIHHWQRFNDDQFIPQYDVELETGELYRGFQFSIFDYDVAIVHIAREGSSTFFRDALTKLLRDAKIALDQGRTIICMPETTNFPLERNNRVYDWVEELGIHLQENVGENIKPTVAGRAQVIQDYLRYAPRYHQILIEPETTPHIKLAVVDDTEIVVDWSTRWGRER